jgi:hypothetical protein
MMHTANTHELLRKGRATLASAGENRVLLGSALIDIHSALERAFRDRLLYDERVPEEIRTRVSSKEVNWPGLVALMQSYSGLREEDGETILRFNQMRNGIVHYGQTYRGTRQELERYARLVETLIAERQPSFDDAAISDELYEASLAMLSVGSPTKRPPDEAAQPPAPQQTSRSQAPRTPDVRPSGYGQRRQEGDRLWIVVLVLVIIFVVWWITNHQGSSTSLSVPASVIAMPLAQISEWFVIVLWFL